MAVTIAHVKSNVPGNFFEHLVDVTGPASYTTGGEVLTAAQVNALMPKLGGALILTDTSKIQWYDSERTTNGTGIVLDRTNSKIMFFAAGAETANATNLSAVTIRMCLRYGNPGE